MDFLTVYSVEVLEPLYEKVIELEEIINKRGIFATKKQKEAYKKTSELYYEKLPWYEKMLDLEK